METPEFLHGLVDDAAIFPPGDAPLDEALTAHREHRRGPYAGLVGGFVVTDRVLPELCDLAAGADPIAVNLVVTGGAGAIAGAVRWAARADAVELRALEVALRDEDDLAHNARRVLAALDAATEELGDAVVHVEPPRVHGEPSPGWLAALDELAAREVRLKLRTGGLTADDFPTSAELAACLDAALDRELPFKCTAGLHRAVRHTAEGGLTHHGFLNVWCATRATLAGEPPVPVLEQTDPDALLAGLDPGELARARRWFTSFGSCSIQEPVDDLVAAGLLGGVA
ncbi:MAG: hypothetical protein ACTHNS_13600 [Marmoricola sp.]